MLPKKYLSLYLLFAISCGSPNHEQELKVFLTEWSVALTARDESIQRFYDPQFAFPKVVFIAAEGLNYTFDIEHVTIASNKDNDDIQVTVPFHLTYPDNTSEEGTIDLTIAKTEKGFLILQMSQQLAMKLKEYNLRQTPSEFSEVTLQYDSLLSGIRKMANSLRQHYDSVVFYTEVDNQILFYVIKGNWEFPYHYESEKQRDAGNYKIGVVTSENKVIIPVAYSKIYNPDGSFNGMIEVENDGVRGLFRISGEVFLPAEYDGIYPTNIKGAFAQVKKGESYGWVANNGKVSFDSSSHENKTLFQSPIETNAILEWEFKFPGPVKLLVDPYTHVEDANGVIIYPSYIRDMGITPIGNGFVFLDGSEFGMGMTDTEIKFEKVESLSDQLFGLISFFMEAGADARGYHSAQNDLLVVDKSMTILDRQEKLTADYDNQDPCGGEPPTYRTIEPGLYESENGNGFYAYYKITEEGTVMQLKTDRTYNFTKFAKIDESYFNRCHYEQIEYRDGNSSNVVVTKGISMEELDIMRNEIFAEYGFIFKSSKWKTYFESKPWYTPQYDNVDQFLTETDKANIKFILEYQRLHKDIQVQRDSIMYWWAG